jgi:hypothetical protein
LEKRTDFQTQNYLFQSGCSAERRGEDSRDTPVRIESASYAEEACRIVSSVRIKKAGTSKEYSAVAYQIVSVGFI